jgi:hypothetical protein
MSISEPGSEAEEDSDWDFVEKVLGANVRDGFLKGKDVTAEVELAKTIAMLSSKTETYCQDCELLFIETPMSQGWCKCTTYSHFTESWRCIPCVLAEEAKQISSQQPYSVTFLFVLLPSESDPEQTYSPPGCPSIQPSLMSTVPSFPFASAVGRKIEGQIVVGPHPGFRAEETIHTARSPRTAQRHASWWK